MIGLSGFLGFLEDSPATRLSAEHYRCGAGKELLVFCIQYGLVNAVGKNSIDEELFGLTEKGEKLIKSKDFNDCLNRIMEGKRP